MNQTWKKLIVLGGVLGTAFSSVFVKFSTVSPTVLVFYRTAMATVLLLPLLLAHRRELRGISKKTFLLAFASGLSLFAHFTTFFASLSYTSVSASGIFVNMEVFFVAAALFFLLDQKIPKRAYSGIVLAFVGSVIIALGDTANGPNPALGNLLALLGALTMSLYTLLGLYCRKEMSTTIYTFVVYGSCALSSGLFSMAVGLPLTGNPPINLACAFGLALCCTMLGHSVFSWSLKYVNAAYVSTAKLAEPIFSTALFFVIFGQRPTIAAVLGGLLVLAGIGLFILAKEEPAAKGEVLSHESKTSSL